MKRFISILTVLCLMLTAVPAFADEEPVMTILIAPAPAKELPGEGGELSGVYKLNADFKLNDDAQPLIVSEAAVSIDLNGYVLDLNGKKIQNINELTITDSNPSSEHLFDASGSYWVLDEANGTEKLTGGIITGGVQAQQAMGGAVQNTGTLTLSGGSFVGNNAYIASAILNMGDLFIDGNVSFTGNYADSNATIVNYATMNVSGNASVKNNGSGMNCGGVYSMTELDISGSLVIEDNRCGEDYCGLWLDSLWGNGILDVTGKLVVRNNLANGKPRNLIIYEGNTEIDLSAVSSESEIGFTLMNTQIFEPKEVAGTVYADADEKIAKILKSDSEDFYAYYDAEEKAVKTESRIIHQPTVADPVYEIGAKDSAAAASYQWYKQVSGAKAVKTAAPKTTADLEDGVKYYCVATLNGKTYTSNTISAHKHTSDAAGGEAFFETALTNEKLEEYLCTGYQWNDETGEEEFLEYSYNIPDGSYYLTEDLHPKGYMQFCDNVSLCLNGYTIEPEETYGYQAILVSFESTTKLYDCKGTGLITGCKYGAVDINGNEGVMYMYGGNISGNEAEEGAGISVSGKLYMYGGNISGNTASRCGGGIYSFGDIELGGSAKISGNTDKLSSNSGIYTMWQVSLSKDVAPITSGADKMDVVIDSERYAQKVVLCEDFDESCLGCFASNSRDYTLEAAESDGTCVLQLSMNNMDKEITRAEFIHCLYNSMFSWDAEEPSGFTDVPEDYIYADELAWAREQGFVNGYTDGSFGVDDKLTVEQLATVMYRVAKYYEVGFEGDWMFLLDASDNAEIAEYADEAMHWMYMKEILKKDESGKLNPKSGVTKKEGFDFINNSFSIIDALVDARYEAEEEEYFEGSEEYEEMPDFEGMTEEEIEAYWDSYWESYWAEDEYEEYESEDGGTVTVVLGDDEE